MTKMAAARRFFWGAGRQETVVNWGTEYQASQGTTAQQRELWLLPEPVLAAYLVWYKGTHPGVAAYPRT